MIVSVLASLLLSAAQPAPADGAEETAVEVGADIDASAETAAEMEDAAEAETAEAAAETADATAEAAEAEAPDAPKVCRRKNIQNAFGKMKTIRVCRPKIED